MPTGPLCIAAPLSAWLLRGPQSRHTGLAQQALPWGDTSSQEWVAQHLPQLPSRPPSIAREDWSGPRAPTACWHSVNPHTAGAGANSPILQMRKLRLRGSKSPDRAHTAGSGTASSLCAEPQGKGGPGPLRLLTPLSCSASPALERPSHTPSPPALRRQPCSVAPSPWRPWLTPLSTLFQPLHQGGALLTPFSPLLVSRWVK